MRFFWIKISNRNKSVLFSAANHLLLVCQLMLTDAKEFSLITYDYNSSFSSCKVNIFKKDTKKISLFSNLNFHFGKMNKKNNDRNLSQSVHTPFNVFIKSFHFFSLTFATKSL